MDKLLKLIVLALTVISLSFSTVCAEEDGLLGGLIFKPGDEYSEDDEKKEEETPADIINPDGYSDMSDLSVVGILKTLGIMGAYSENQFKPNVYVSRAEFLSGVLKLICVEYDEVEKSDKVFYDVDKNHTYANAIYTAVSYGIVTGYDNNSFKPDDVISYTDGLIMTIRALGYTRLAELSGNDTAAYLKYASSEGLMKGTAPNNRLALTRLEMARILYNGLYADMIELVGLNSDKTEKRDSVMHHYYNIYEASGKMTQNSVTSLDGQKIGDSIIHVDKTEYGVDNKNYDSLIGCKVDYYYDATDNSIVFMNKNKDVRETIIDAENLSAYNAKTRQLSYYKDEKNKSVKLSDSLNIIYNGMLVENITDESIFSIKSGTVTVISNNNGGENSVVKINENQNLFVKSVSVDGNVISVSVDFDIPMFEINTDDTYVEIVNEEGNQTEVYQKNDKGEEKINVSAIPKNSVCSFYTDITGQSEDAKGNKIPSEHAKYIKIVVSKNTVEGSISRINEENVLLNGEEYKVSGSNFFYHSDSELNYDIGVYYLDHLGFLVCKKTGASSDWKYAYLIRPNLSDEEDGKIASMKLLLTSGKIVTYLVSENLYINEKKAKSNAKTMLSNSAKLVNDGFEYSQLVKYMTDESGEVVTKLQTVTASIGIDDDYGSNQLSRYCERKVYNIAYDTKGRFKEKGSELGSFFAPGVVMQVSGSEDTDEKYYSITSFTSNSASYSNVSCDAFDVKNLTPAVVVYYSDNESEKMAVTGNGTTTYPVMYKGSQTVYSEEEEIVLEIEVAMGWEVAKFYSDELTICDEFDKGDLINLYTKSNKIVKILPITYSSGDNNGKKVTPFNLPDIENGYNVSVIQNSGGETVGSYKNFGECYSVVNATNFVVQFGAMVDEIQREFQKTACFHNAAWQHGGSILYEETDKEPVIRQATIADLRPANEYGSKASKILWIPIHGGTRQYVIYNMK